MGILRRGMIIAAATAPLLAAAVVPAVPATQQSQRVRYDASLYGLPVARAVFESRFEGRGFAVSGRFASAGIARIFDATNGTVTATGWLGRGESQPNQYTLDYRTGKKQQKTVIRFSRGRVSETLNQPELKKRGDDWVPLKHEHLSGVADPLSALLVPVANPAEVCNRTIRVYDGEIRADIVLQPASNSERFRNAAITCNARFVPVAGYRKNHSSITYLRDRARMLVGFEQVEGHNLYSPVEATIATKVGRVHIRARPM